jgi:hypothetical protein
MLAVLILFLLPWLEWSGRAYAGFEFMDLIEDLRQSERAASVAPVTWHLLIVTPLAAVLALIADLRGRRSRTSDFLASAAVALPAFALLFVFLERLAVRVLPGGYAVLLVSGIGVVALLLDRRGGS